MKTEILKRQGLPKTAAIKKGLIEKYDIHPYVAEIVSSRIPEDEIAAFLKPDIRNMPSPYLFNDMEKALELIHKAVRENRKICVYGDYDVDGLSATAILFRTLNKMASDITFHIPERNSDGYGITIESAEKLASQGIGLLISVDCGSSDKEAVAYLKEHDIDTIITDHHICDGNIGADAFINPKNPGEKYPYKDLCGAGVAFKLACALSGKSAFNFIDLAAVATIADMVPLTGENRIIAAKGLYKIKNAPDPSIKALLDASGIDSKNISSEQISFVIAPRINAAGRVESPKKAFELIRDAMTDQEKLGRIAEELCSINQRRQNLQREMLMDAKARLGAFSGNSIVIKGASWEPGLLGLTASKLVNDYGVPVVMLSYKTGQWIGSARSVDEVNIYDVLSNFKDMFIRFGGHSMAAGLTVKEDCLESFMDGFTEYMNSEYDSGTFSKKEYYDMEADIEDINLKLVKDLSLIEPIGVGNPNASFLFRNVEITDKRPLGNGSHSRFTAIDNGNTIGCVAFGRHINDIPVNGDILASVKVNSYTGKAELFVDDIW